MAENNYTKKMIYQNKIVDANEKTFLVRYYILRGKFKGKYDRYYYGVLVEKLLKGEGMEEFIVDEEASVAGVSENMTEVMEIIQRLHDGEVTPMSLYEVLDELCG